MLLARSFELLMLLIDPVLLINIALLKADYRN